MSKYVNLDNLKTFLRQLKTHITDPIVNDVSTLTTKVRNAENNIQTANSNISSVQQALNDKADKNHKHTIADVTITDNIVLENTKQIIGKDNFGSYSNLITMDKFNQANVGDSRKCDNIVLASKSAKISAFDGNNTYIVYHSGNINNNKFALQVNVKHYINNSDLLTYVDSENTQMQFKKSGLYKITVTKANNQTSGISFCDTSLDFETKGNVLVGYNVGLYEPVSSSLVMHIDKTKIYEFFGFETGNYQGATSYTKYRGAEFKTKLQGSNILIELIKEC